MATRNELCWLRHIIGHIKANDNGLGLDLAVQANILARQAQRDAAAKKEARKAARRKGTGSKWGQGMTMTQIAAKISR